MLIELTVSNYRSFHESTVFSMIASREQKFRSRLPRLESRYRISVNPISGVFGANGAGKSNLVRALADFKLLMLEPPRRRQPLRYQPFALADKGAESPSDLSIVFSYEDIIYEYELSFFRSEVVAESLTKILSTSDRLLFTRRPGKIDLGGAENVALRALVDAVPRNVPLVSYLAQLDVRDIPRFEEFIVPFRWFEKLLVIPAGYLDRVRTNPFAPVPFVDGWKDFITTIGVGVSGVAEEKVGLSALRLSDDQLEELLEDVQTDGLVVLELPSGRFEVRSADDEVEVSRVSLLHEGDGVPVEINWMDESDGTRSVVGLFSLFSILSRSPAGMTLVIDELDRSFHTELSRSLIDGFLNSCSASSRSQLIFTTHDLLLMDPDRLRRDEMWIAEKDERGTTQLIALSEYEGIRVDKDIRKSYLAGRFGGVPSIKPLDFSFPPRGASSEDVE